MKDLAKAHWIGGTALAVAGALAYRLGPALVGGQFRIALQIAGLALASAGLFWIARGVSREATQRAEHDQPDEPSSPTTD